MAREAMKERKIVPIASIEEYYLVAGQLQALITSGRSLEEEELKLLEERLDLFEKTLFPTGAGSARVGGRF